MARRILAALAGLSGATVAMASGCGALDGYDCAELLACDVINEDGTSNAACEGTCVDVDVSGFEDEPRIVWIGPASEQPSCGEALLDEPRSDAGVTMIEYERLVAEPGHVGCGPCACTEPACVLPAGLTVTSGWMCGNSPDETVTLFRAPRGWDGACVAPGAVAPEAFGSFDVAPVTERPCEVALVPAPRNGDLPGGQIAVVCTGGVERTCPSDDAWCMVGAERLGAGFRRCIFSTMEGDHAVCPSSDGVADLTFSDRFTFWNVRDDTRRCTPCACAETAPSLCEALVSTFEDEACVDLVAAAAVAENGVCHDAEPGSALGSLRAEWRVNAPGSCAPSGGELVGDLIVERRTLCCLPEGT